MARRPTAPGEHRETPGRVLAALLVGGLGAALAAAVLDLSGEPGGLTGHALTHLDATGIAHPVTAVLLSFRGYDTWLELTVLLAAVLGALAVARTGDPADASPDTPPRLAGDPILAALARRLVPVMVLAAGYLLWLGSHAPGGAFQAGAVLASAAVVLRMAGHPSVAAIGDRWRRALLAAGFLAFLAVALGALAAGRPLLAMPAAAPGTVALLVEIAATLSIGLTLATLFVAAQLRDR